MSNSNERQSDAAPSLAPEPGNTADTASASTACCACFSLKDIAEVLSPLMERTSLGEVRVDERSISLVFGHCRIWVSAQGVDRPHLVGGVMQAGLLTKDSVIDVERLPHGEPYLDALTSKDLVS